MPPQDASDDFTVFISYAHKDNEDPEPSRRWLNRLLEQLQPLVLRNKVGVWSDTQIEAGEQWEQSIKAHLQNAKIAVLLVSPAFLASKYIRNSELPVLLMNALNRGATVIPVIVRHCLFAEATFKYPDPAHGPGELSLSVFQAANPPDRPLNAMPEHEQDAVLLSVAKRILELARTESLTGRASEGAAVWSIPHPHNLLFTGRAQVFDELQHSLSISGKAALSGMGGIGKTQTAVEYAYRHSGEYKAVLWARADTEESFKADLAALAVKLNLPQQGEADRESIVSAVKQWLERHDGWLLLMDNADDLEPVSELLLHEWRGHLLLTTRARATGSVISVEITEMTPEEGSLFLLRRAKLIRVNDAAGAAAEVDQKLATEIAREVGGLPLALDQAGAFIEEMSSSLAEYLELYRREGATLRARRGEVKTDHKPVTITFSLAFQQVASASAAAADMLRACAFLATEAIPEEIFTNGAAELGEHISAAVGEGLGLVKMIGEAARFSLIRRNARSGTIEIHRVVQQVLRDELGAEEQRQWAERVVRALSAAFPNVEHQNWPVCEKFLPHAQEAAGLIDEYGFEFAEAARLLNEAGNYCTERAQYREAGPLLVRALSIYEKVLGPDHPRVATSLNNLALLYRSQGRYAEAERLTVRALSIREKVLGPDHPSVANSLNNLALLYRSQGRYAEAEPLYVRALSIVEKVLGPDHPHTSIVRENYTALLQKMQDKTEE